VFRVILALWDGREACALPDSLCDRLRAYVAQGIAGDSADSWIASL